MLRFIRRTDWLGNFKNNGVRIPQSVFTMIFGDKTSALLDLWSIEHFITGITLGAAVNRWSHRRTLAEEARLYINFLTLLLLAFIWETIEFYLETGHAGRIVAQWLHGVEFWANRLIADPVMVCLGWLTLRHRPNVLWPARGFSLVWLCAHVGLFPHSMFLQEVLVAAWSQLSASI